MQSMIRDTLAQMIRSNQRNPSSLEGGAFCANFQATGGDGPWIQAKVGALNLHFPFEQPPAELFAQCRLDDLPSMAFPAWKANQFATVTFQELPLDAFAAYIDRLFRTLYDLPADYRVDTDIFDMR